jgi:hypothetical protein
MQISDFFKSIRKSSSDGEPEKELQGPVTGAADAVVPDSVPLEAPPVSSPIIPPTSPLVPKKPDASYRHYFQLLKGKANSSVEEYDFERHGTLVDASLPEDYEQLDQYWVEKGRSLIIIAHNRKTNQKEYLLFEPTLSDFEYELLERLHEDLRDVLILTSDEIRKDRKRLLLEKMYPLLDDYGLALEPSTKFKLQY